MRQNENVFSNIDLPLFFAMILLMIFGIATVYSVSFNPNHPLLFAPSEKYGKQFIWLCVSLFVGFLILLINSEIYRKYAEYLFVFTILMLVLVLFMPPVHGARAWLGFGGLGIQPAEFAKISTALLMAKWVAQTNIKLQNMRTVSETVGIILLPSLLVALQPDAGTLLVFTSFLFVLYREGISFDPIVFRLLRLVTRFKFTSTWVGTHFIPLLFFMVILCVFSLYTSESSLKLGENVVVSGTAGMIFAVTGLALLVLGAVFLWGFKRFRVKNLIILLGSYLFAVLLISSVSIFFNQLAAPHQKNRIELVLGLKEDPNGSDYNRNRAMASVGSGQFLGKGYKKASVSSVKTNHVHESETDFIFCPFAEEWGFVGSLVLVLLYLFLLFRIFFIAERQRSVFFRVYCYCVGMILFYHFAINIGMNIGLAPVIGIPLPFMSYGGSSLLSFTIMLFILLKLDSQRKDVLR
jgi:rod shape determining protein RodA